MSTVLSFRVRSKEYRCRLMTLKFQMENRSEKKVYHERSLSDRTGTALGIRAGCILIRPARFNFRKLAATVTVVQP